MLSKMGKGVDCAPPGLTLRQIRGGVSKTAVPTSFKPMPKQVEPVVPLFSPEGERLASLTPEEEERVSKYLVENARFAEMALEFFNNKNGTDFVLVKPMFANTVPGCGFFEHLNFMARPKHAPADQPSTLFFAELFWTDEVTMCCTLPVEGSSSTSAGFAFGCETCLPDHKFRIYHPFDGFQAGC